MSELKINNTKQEKATIEVTEHPVFEGDMKTNIISSIDMCDIVSSLFAPAFSDYYGCKICINDGRNPVLFNKLPAGALYVDLFFKDQGKAPEGTWKNIKLRGVNYGDNEATDIGTKFQLLNKAQFVTTHKYDVTKETYEALEEFMTTGNRTRWSEHTQEINTNMSLYGKEEVVVSISGLDLNKIITKIYGAKTEEGRYEYIATPSTIIPSKTQEFIMQVCQLDLAAVRNLQKTLGIYSADVPQFHQYQR